MTALSVEDSRAARRRWLKISYHRVLTVGWVLAAYVMIQINALGIVAAIYGHFTPRPLSLTDHVVALLCTLAPALILPLRSTPASSAAWVFYIFAYMSGGAIGISVLGSVAAYLPFVGFLAMGLAIFHTAARIRLPVVTPLLRVRNGDVLLMLGVAGMVLYIWWLAGFSLRFDFADVYARRLDARETGGSSGYIMAPLRLVLPVLAVYAWQTRRNFAWPLLVALGCLAVFSFDGTKSMLLFPVLLWLIMIGLGRDRLPTFMLGATVLINVAAYLEATVFSSAVLAEYVIRRAFIVPGLLSSIYWEFAPQATDLKMITYDVGRIYFNSPETNANTNFLMWGLAWRGWLGASLVALAGGLIVALFSSFPGPRFPKLGALMAAGCALFWAEQFLHTSLLTSGVALLVVVAIAFRVAPGGFIRLGLDRT